MQPSTSAIPQHHYSTRIRQNPSSLKQSTRLRSSPDPSTSSRTAKPSPTLERIHPDNYPKFPPEDVVLHPDDANSKVFLAIGRAFLSVDNRAMTIKDLAEMTSNYGLVCQNNSAAGQAITTYIRNHLQRCEEQDDQPLLLRHDLSGNASDDDLAPGLYSRSGGAHCPKSENRLTNFRRGTSVWYLSRATGAPCPFARANIRLCDYVGIADKPTAIVPAPVPLKRIQQAESCGQKRKRRTRNRTRGLEDGENTSDASGLDDPPPPPKVKLTLRLKPLMPRTPAQPSLSITSREVICLDSDDERSCSDDEADGMSDMHHESRSCLPKYPKRAMSIPSSEPVFYGASPFRSSTDRPFAHRSPSVPTNMPSPPPDSEEEYMDSEESDADCDADLDSDVDGESFGPRSPSAPAMASTTRVSIKADFEDSIDVWDEDIPAADFTLHYQAGELLATKVEDMDWQSPMFDHGAGWYSPVDAGSPSSVDIKQEEADMDYSLLSPLSQAYSPSSPSEVRRHSDFGIGPSGDSFFALEPGLSSNRTRSITSAASLPPPWSSPPAKDALSLPPLTPTSSSLSTMLGTLSVQSPTFASPPSPLTPLSECSLSDTTEPTIYHTSEPCSPAISATYVEGILVYQMLLGTSRLLRRVDTDFVNLTPIVNCLGFAPTLSKDVADAFVVSQGSSLITGNWVPLATARRFVQDHPVPIGLLDTFLLPTLFKHFPPVLQGSYRSSAEARELNQFGPHFSSTMEADRTQSASSPVPHPPLSPSLILPLVSQAIPLPQENGFSEEELFQQFCCIPDSEKEHVVASDSPPDAMDVIIADEDEVEQELEVVDKASTPEEDGPSRPPSPKPLRRSKRVADAVASISQPPPTKSRRRKGRKSSS
jgi:hypothetical protein